MNKDSGGKGELGREEMRDLNCQAVFSENEISHTSSGSLQTIGSLKDGRS